MLGGRELLLPASIAVAMETAQPNSEAKGPGSNLPPEISMADQTLVPFRSQMEVSVPDPLAPAARRVLGASQSRPRRRGQAQ